MKKKLLSIILLSLAVTSFGQITIMNNDIASVGTTVYLANDTISTGIVPGDPGANKTWDFTSVVANTIDTLAFVLPSSTPYGGEFPEANLAFSSSDVEIGNVYGYMLKNNDKYSSIGYAFESEDTAIYMANIEPENIILDFPVNYQNSYNEVYITDIVIGSPTPGADSVRTKSTVVKETTIDAWGSITIPMGTYNALRQRVDEDQTDSLFMKMGGTWTFIFASEESSTTYSWWTDDINIGFMLFSIDIDNDFGGEVFGISFLVGSAVGLFETNMTITKVYPNPVADIVNFEFDESITGELFLMNGLGQVVVRENLNGQKFSQLNLSQLPAGMYIYRATNQRGELLSSGKVQKR